MKRLHILVLKSFIGPFVLIFFIVLFILLMQFLWRYIDELVGKGLEIKVIGELLLYTSASLVPMALPLSLLMASLMTFGNMGEFYELTAIKSSGISLQRIMMPLAIVVVFISIGAFFFANEILPFTNLKMRSLLYDVRKQRPEIQIMPGTFYNGMEAFSIRIDSKDPVTNMMYNIKIYDHTSRQGNTSVCIADSGSMIVTDDKRNLIFTLYNGYAYNEMQDERTNRRESTYPHRFDKFEEQRIIIELVGFGLERTDESLFKSHYQMMNLGQLSSMEDSISVEIVDKQKVLFNTLLRGSYFKRRDIGRGREYYYNQIPERPAYTANTDTFSRHSFLMQQRKIKASGKKDPKQIPVKKPIAPSPGKTMVPHKKEASINTNPNLKNVDTWYYDTYDQLTIREKEIILDDALINARTARTYALNSIESIKYKIKLLRRFEIEWQRKFTIAFACFVFFLIGAPLGAIIRKGGLGLPLVISTLFFIFYYIISLMGEKFVRESLLPDYQGMWISTGLFFVTGIFLTYKATTDSSILNLDTYANFFKKFGLGRRLSLIEVLDKTKDQETTRQVKKVSLLTSLSSLIDTTNEQIIKVNNTLRLADFTISMLSMQTDTDIIIFERFYKNNIASITRSKLYEDRLIYSKLGDYPDFKSGHYTDSNIKLIIKFILTALPPFTVLIIIRHYIRLLTLKTKLKNIHHTTQELIHLVKISDFTD